MVEGFCVDPKRVHEVWPHCKHLIESAVRRTGLGSWSETEDAVLTGDELLWVVWNGKTIEAAITTLLSKTDTKPVCVVTACGGKDMRRWLPLFAQIESYAKAEGCSCVRIYGRKGWSRVLEQYTTKNVILERSL